MPAIGVKVEGARALSRALRKAGVSVQDMKEANQRVGEVVVRAATPLAPKRTGRLAGSIRAAKVQSGAVVRAGGGSIKYAPFVEYGTKKMGARPYLTKGMANSQPNWLAVYDKELQKLMNTVAAQSPGTGE